MDCLQPQQGICNIGSPHHGDSRGAPFSQAEYDFFSAMAEYLASTAAAKAYVAPFYAAMGGRGALDTRLPSPAPSH